MGEQRSLIPAYYCHKIQLRVGTLLQMVERKDYCYILLLGNTSTESGVYKMVQELLWCNVSIILKK